MALVGILVMVEMAVILAALIPQPDVAAAAVVEANLIQERLQVLVVV